MLRALASLAALVAGATVGCAGAPDGPVAASVREQVLDGDPAAFDAQLASLRGRPVVVSESGIVVPALPREIEHLNRLARERAGDVAFVGVVTRDDRASVEQFLGEVGAGFPSYIDDEGEISKRFGGERGFPSTAFYDRSGALVKTHLGLYPSPDALEADIERFAVDG